MWSGNEATTVRPFANAAEYEGMIDYFLGGGDEFLAGMGVDLAKLPTREEWLRAALADHARPDAQKERFYVAWLLDERIVGHSSISHIELGETAHCHLHLWEQGLRRTGMGSAFLRGSIDLYFERFALKSLASEPYAENPAPNRALPKLGFRLVRRYRTVPTGMAFEQDVNRYEIARTTGSPRHRRTGSWHARQRAGGSVPRSLYVRIGSLLVDDPAWNSEALLASDSPSGSHGLRRCTMPSIKGQGSWGRLVRSVPVAGPRDGSARAPAAPVGPTGFPRGTRQPSRLFPRPFERIPRRRRPGRPRPYSSFRH